jgi:hypothetical protein
MKIEGKFFLQSAASWLFMPLVITFAHITGLAHEKEFITTLLIISSIYPIQIYFNEVIAPFLVRSKLKLSYKYLYKIGCGTFALVGFAGYLMKIDFYELIFIYIFSFVAIWLAFINSIRILELQVKSIIGGRYSSILGSIIPLSFFILIFFYYVLFIFGLSKAYLLYTLIFLPTVILFLYVKNNWIDDYCNDNMFLDAPNLNSKFFYLIFLVSILMALVTQYWKVQLTEFAVGFSALSLYLITPFSTLWLIFSKSKYLSKSDNDIKDSIFIWIPPLFLIFIFFIESSNVFFIFFLALLSQILTFKFISDARIKLSLCLK